MTACVILRAVTALLLGNIAQLFCLARHRRGISRKWKSFVPRCGLFEHLHIRHFILSDALSF